MNYDVACPYCGENLEVCHDDGLGVEEDTPHEMECYECEKNFVFYTTISFSYEASIADCLNGSDHKLKPTTTYPKEYTRMACSDCGYSRRMTGVELKEALVKQEKVT